MDVAALGLSVEDKNITDATASLERFAKSADQAGRASDTLSAGSRKAESSTLRLAKEMAATQNSAAMQAVRLAETAEAADRYANASNRAGVTVEQAERYMRKASIQLEQMAKAERAAAAGADELTRGAKGASAAAADMANEAMRAAERTRSVDKTSKSAAFAVRNLTYQFSDAVQGLIMGQKPLQVLIQQGPQAADAFAMLAAESGGAGKAVAALATKFGPWAAAAGIAIAGVSGALKIFTDDINENAKVTVTWKDTVLGIYDALRSYLADTLGPTFQQVAEVAGKAWEWIAEASKRAANIAIGAALAVPKVIAATYDKLPAAFGDAFYSAANLAIEALNWLVQKSAAPLNAIIDGLNWAFNTKMPHVVFDGIDKIANPYAGAMSSLGSAGAKALTGAFQRDYIGEFEKFVSPFAQARAQKRLADDAAKAGKDAGATAGKALGNEFAKELAKALEQLARTTDNAFYDIIMRGRRGLAAAWESDWNQLLDNLRHRTTDVTTATADWNAELRKTIDFLDQIGGKGRDLGDIAAAIVGLTTGDWSGTRGPVASLIQTLGGITWRDPADDKGPGEIRILREEITRIFDGDSGTFTKTMATLLQGAGTGAAVGSIMGGGKTAQFGSMIGGALGQQFGGQVIGAISSKLLSSLGGAAGPIGAIAGSILGNVLGKALSGNEKGRATFSGGSFTVTGDNAQRESAANDLAKSVTDALKQIGAAFGAEVGSFTGMIGVRNSSIRYDPNGASLKKGANFGQDSAAAIAAAISDAISDGVFTGLSEGVERLLKNGGDLETQLQKALSFQGVFDELRQMKDPQGAALDDLTKWHDNMLAIFNEAGATSDQLAQLEELTGLKRTEIAEKYGDAITAAEDLTRQKRLLDIQIMQLEGKAREAVLATRQMELAEADAELHSRMKRIYALQDEAAAAEEAAKRAQQLADARSVEDQIIRNVIDGTREMTKALRDYADALFGTNGILDPMQNYIATLKQAAQGDQAAIRGLPDAINAYLPSALKGSSSLIDYQLQAALARQAANDVADFTDARSAANLQVVLGRDTPESMIDRLERAMEKLNATVERADQNNVQVGTNQIRKLNNIDRTLDGATDGGYAMRTQAA